MKRGGQSRQLLRPSLKVAEFRQNVAIAKHAGLAIR